MTQLYFFFFFFFYLLGLVWKLEEGTEETCEPQHQYQTKVPQERRRQPGRNISPPSFSETPLRRSHCDRALLCSMSR